MESGIHGVVTNFPVGRLLFEIRHQAFHGGGSRQQRAFLRVEGHMMHAIETSGLVGRTVDLIIIASSSSDHGCDKDSYTKVGLHTHE